MKSAPLVLAAAGAVLAAFGQVSLKFGADGRVAPMEFINGWVALGLAQYLAGAALWLAALSSLPLMAVYPFTALTYVLVNTLAFVLFNERLSPQGLLGTAIVLIGLFLVATSVEVHHAPR
jgi:undecaprenyl phosphate-alpha-L-ara4N flippase subunit ArnE